MQQNFPNPFNPTTAIRYDLPNEEKVALRIYNLLGEETVTLIDDEVKAAGFHTAVWNGKNSSGQYVPSGVYIYRLQAGKFTDTKKMLLVR